MPGEIADMMLDGTMCQLCGEFLDGEAGGYPMYCAGCAPDATPAQHKKRHDAPFFAIQKAGDVVGLKAFLETAQYDTVEFGNDKFNNPLARVKRRGAARVATICIRKKEFTAEVSSLLKQYTSH